MVVLSDKKGNERRKEGGEGNDEPSKEGGEGDDEPS